MRRMVRRHGRAKQNQALDDSLPASLHHEGTQPPTGSMGSTKVFCRALSLSAYCPYNGKQNQALDKIVQKQRNHALDLFTGRDSWVSAGADSHRRSPSIDSASHVVRALCKSSKPSVGDCSTFAGMVETSIRSKAGAFGQVGQPIATRQTACTDAVQSTVHVPRARCADMPPYCQHTVPSPPPGWSHRGATHFPARSDHRLPCR